MKLALVFVLGLVLQLALTAAHLPWLLAACQPLLLVTVFAARTFPPIGVAWTGLAAGIATAPTADEPEIYGSDIKTIKEQRIKELAQLLNSPKQ